MKMENFERLKILEKEWDNEKNVISFKDVLKFSNKKYFWKCPKGHSYEMSMDKRYGRNCNCHICSNHKVVKGVNDFTTLYPELLKDIDFENNKNTDIYSLSKGSEVIIDWKCHKCGHIWKNTIKNSCKKEVNCPKCSLKLRGKKKHETSLKEKGSLDDEVLLKEWDYIKNELPPSNYTKGSGKEVYWNCSKCGYNWKAKISNRTLLNRGCPCCSNRVVVQGVNDLLTTNPELCKEWDYEKNKIKPTEVTRGQRIKVWWKCPNGHSYQTTINHRTSKNGTGCPTCFESNQTSFREQATYFYIKQIYPNAINKYKPDFLKPFELDIYIPELSLAIEYDGAFWHRKKEEREIRKYNSCSENKIKLWRIREEMNGHSSKIADKLFNVENIDNDREYENLLKLILRELDPKTNIFTIKSAKYLTYVHDVNLERDKNIILKYKSEIKGSLEELYPDIAKEWHPTLNGTIKPNMIKPNSNKQFWWLCPLCKKEYYATPGHRVNGTACKCNSLERQILARKKNLLLKKGGIKNQALLKQWNYPKNDPLTPNDFTEGSGEKVWWLCDKCGYEWKAKISNRNNGRGCPKCAGKLLIEGYNDFKTCCPELLKEWMYEKNIGLDPAKIHKGSTKRVWWQCSTCGYEYIAPLARRIKGSGCRKCADKKLLNNKFAAKKRKFLISEEILN